MQYTWQFISRKHMPWPNCIACVFVIKYDFPLISCLMIFLMEVIHLFNFKHRNLNVNLILLVWINCCNYLLILQYIQKSPVRYPWVQHLHANITKMMLQNVNEKQTSFNVWNSKRRVIFHACNSWAHVYCRILFPASWISFVESNMQWLKGPKVKSLCTKVSSSHRPVRGAEENNWCQSDFHIPTKGTPVSLLWVDVLLNLCWLNLIFRFVSIHFCYANIRNWYFRISSQVPLYHCRRRRHNKMT